MPFVDKPHCLTPQPHESALELGDEYKWRRVRHGIQHRLQYFPTLYQSIEAVRHLELRSNSNRQSVVQRVGLQHVLVQLYRPRRVLWIL
jgi:D-alanyl-D-alanine dipeptidase